MQHDASVRLARGHFTLGVGCIAGHCNQVMVAVAVGDQRRRSVGFEEVQGDGLGGHLGAVELADEDRRHLNKTKG